MPRETIQGHPHTVNPYEVKVGWAVDCDVQVGVEMPGHVIPQLLGVHAEYATNVEQTRAVADLGAVIREALDGLSPTDDVGIGRAVSQALSKRFDHQGVWADLDRGGVNKLIKVLRRARDSAFGRDE